MLSPHGRGCCETLCADNPNPATASQAGTDFIALVRNFRALASQLMFRAKARQALEDSVSARRQAARRSQSSAPTADPPITSRGPATGNAATGTPGESLQQHEAERVGLAWKH